MENQTLSLSDFDDYIDEDEFASQHTTKVSKCFIICTDARHGNVYFLVIDRNLDKRYQFSTIKGAIDKYNDIGS